MQSAYVVHALYRNDTDDPTKSAYSLSIPSRVFLMNQIHASCYFVPVHTRNEGSYSPMLQLSSAKFPQEVLPQSSGRKDRHFIGMYIGANLDSNLASTWSPALHCLTSCQMTSQRCLHKGTQHLMQNGHDCVETAGDRKVVRVDGVDVLLFWYRNQIYCIEAR